MKTATNTLILAAVMAATLPALAAVSADEAAKLKSSLTPVGAEKAGNAAGTIPAWDGGALVAELAWNRLLSVTKNPSAVGFGGLDPNTTRDAMALRVIFEPQYFQVLPGLDLSVPISLGYNFGGRSSAIFNFAGGASNAGDLSIGIKGKYQNDWNFGLSYTTFFGKENTFTIADPPTPTRMLSFGQTLKDRAYVAFSASRTF